MRTGQLVVRFHSPLRRRALSAGMAIGLVLLLYGMFEWGRFEGGYSKFAEIQRRRELNAQIETLQDQSEKLRAEVAAAQLAREVDRKSYGDVEKNLADLQAQVLKHREELTFYRGIVSPEDGIGGLKLQRFQVVPGSSDLHYRLRLVLVQSMRQEATVSGAVNIQVEGSQDGHPKQLALAEIASGVRGDGLLPFQFRYFQNLEQDIVLPKGFEPRAVTIEVRSGHNPAVRESYPWLVQNET
jgi:uncharacterized protein DUF6776